MFSTSGAVSGRRVFVTGGAGFLGINLIRHLLTRGMAIVSFDIAEFDYPERAAVVAVKGDIRDYEALRIAMAGSDLVIHSAAALPLYPVAQIMSTEVDGTRNVLEAASQHGIS